jgi:DNA primase
MLLTNLSQRLGIGEQQVRDRFRELRTKSTQRPAVHRRQEEPRQPHVEIERLLQGRATTEDRYELPVLEALFSLPASLSFLQGELPPEALQNRAIRRLYEIGLAFAQSKEAPGFERYLAAIEHPDLKRLAVWIDDQARAKGVNVQLQETEADGGCPLFLRRAISNLKWRREEQAQQQAAVKLTAAGDGPRGLDAEAESLLRQASEFHQRRATRKATG